MHYGYIIVLIFLIFNKSIKYESSKTYAQYGKYFLFLSDVDSSDIFISPASQVSLNKREIIELFLASILNLSLKDEFVIESRLTLFKQAWR